MVGIILVDADRVDDEVEHRGLQPGVGPDTALWAPLPPPPARPRSPLDPPNGDSLGDPVLRADSRRPRPARPVNTAVEAKLQEANTRVAAAEERCRLAQERVGRLEAALVAMASAPAISSS